MRKIMTKLLFWILAMASITAVGQQSDESRTKASICGSESIAAHPCTPKEIAERAKIGGEGPNIFTSPGAVHHLAKLRLNAFFNYMNRDYPNIEKLWIFMDVDTNRSIAIDRKGIIIIKGMTERD